MCESDPPSPSGSMDAQTRPRPSRGGRGGARGGRGRSDPSNMFMGSRVPRNKRGKEQAPKLKTKSTAQRIRDIERLLRKVRVCCCTRKSLSAITLPRLIPDPPCNLHRQEDLPATIRVVQERMLVALQSTQQDDKQSEKEKKLQLRYRKVKFFGASTVKRGQSVPACLGLCSYTL